MNRCGSMPIRKAALMVGDVVVFRKAFVLYSAGARTGVVERLDQPYAEFVHERAKHYDREADAEWIRGFEVDAVGPDTCLPIVSIASCPGILGGGLFAVSPRHFKTVLPGPGGRERN